MGGGSQAEFAADELADELHLTPLSAAEQIDFACTVATKLPRTFAALAAGQIHPVHVRIIEDEIRFLAEEDAAKADAMLAEQASGMTFGELRHAAHKLVLKLDPDAARKRKEAARQEAHVRRFRENSGNAGMVARELPSDEILASWQHVEQRALDLRAAGLPGTLQELRVRAYLDLLQERDSRPPLADPGSAGKASAPDESPTRPPGPGNGPEATPGGQDRPDGSDGPWRRAGRERQPGGSGGPGGSAPAPSRVGDGPSVAALVTITIPWATLQSQSEVPGEAGGFGLLDGDDARDLAAATARHPRTRWCVTALNPDGTAAAHGCLPGCRRRTTGPVYPAPAPQPHHAPPATGHPPRRQPPAPHGLAHPDHPADPPGPRPLRPRPRRDRLPSQPQAGPPDPGAQRPCTAPGCRRPAARCDLDHTTAWDQGGITCECGLAPPCQR